MEPKVRHYGFFAVLVLPLLAAQGCDGSRAKRVLDPDSPLTLELHLEEQGGSRTTRFDTAETITLVLEVRNVSAGPVDLRFRSQRVFDFVVQADNDSIVWTWSDDRTFSSAFTTIVFDPGETETVRVQWDQRRFDGLLAGRGRFRAWGLLPAESGELQSRTVSFRIE